MLGICTSPPPVPTWRSRHDMLCARTRGSWRATASSAPTTRRSLQPWPHLSWLCFETNARTSGVALMPLFDVRAILSSLPIMSLDEASGPSRCATIATTSATHV